MPPSPISSTSRYGPIGSLGTPLAAAAAANAALTSRSSVGDAVAERRGLVQAVQQPAIVQNAGHGGFEPEEGVNLLAE